MKGKTYLNEFAENITSKPYSQDFQTAIESAKEYILTNLPKCSTIELQSDYRRVAFRVIVSTPINAYIPVIDLRIPLKARSYLIILIGQCGACSKDELTEFLKELIRDEIELRVWDKEQNKIENEAYKANNVNA